MTEKSTAEKIWTKVKETFVTAATAAVLVLVVILIIWIPIKLIPKIFSKSSSYLATSLSSTFIPEGNSSSTKVTSNNIPPSTTQTNNQNTSPVYTQRTYTGQPDLAVRLLAVGTIDRYTKQFSQAQYTNSTDEIGIRFEVVNVGNGASGIWTFKASLPSLTTPNYQSNSQISLNPGDKIQYTLGFDNPSSSGTNSAYITINPPSSGTDSNNSNNALNVPISIVGTTNYNYSNYGVVNGNGYPYNYGNNNNNTYNYNGGTTYTWTSLSGSCNVSPSNAYAGNVVTWSANASGGNGYYTYSWNGTEDLFSTEKSPSKIYRNSGTKLATVTITSNGQSITKQCSVEILNQYNQNYGAADLALSLVGVGTIDSSGQFIQSSQVAKGGIAAIKVRVSNISSGYSSSWSITGAISPSLPGYTYRQDNQPSIYAGGNSEYTIVFGNPQVTGDNTFDVRIIPNSGDLNSSNNSLSAIIRIY